MMGRPVHRCGCVWAIAVLAFGCSGEIGDPGLSGSGSPGSGREVGGFASDPGGAASDPGRVTLHRLNRVEYNNTVRDLLGTDQTPADDFPNDDRGYGFDNNADVLSLSPLHLEMYQGAAETLVAEAMAGASRAEIFTCSPSQATEEDCAREILGAFARRAWRRAVRDAEIARLLPLIQIAEDEGEDFEAGVGLALEAVLISPHFIFRVELDPDPSSPVPHALSEYELASRLSYFLWSSMPDDELLDLAEAGTLSEEAELGRQVNRMLDDPKAAAFTDNFAGQWLYTRAVDDIDPDRGLYPEFDDSLADAMKRETSEFFSTFVRDDLPLGELLTAGWTPVDDIMAGHYGLSDRPGSDVVRVTLPSETAAGILSKASVLAGTSLPTRTSPVKRGVWVLDQLLCSELPPPPPGVEGLEEVRMPAETVREQLEQHRADPACAGCHDHIDPIGLGLEAFDALGRYRTEDNGAPVDSSGVLPTGEAFDGPAELGRLLAGDPRFAHCTAEQLMTYALGRGPISSDSHWYEAIVERSESGGFREIVRAVVLSRPFRMRRGEGESP